MGRFGSSLHYLSFNQCNSNGLTQNEINELKNYLKNDFLNVCENCNEKGDKGDMGKQGSKGDMGICREPRELIYAKINIFENIFINCINHCELINTYFFSLKILNTNIDNLFIENDCIILNDQGMYNIDTSIHINYLNRFEKFNINLILFIYDDITNEFKPLIETLSTHLINGNINKKNDETLNYTLKLQKLLNLNNAKIKIGAYFDELQYIDDISDYIGNERFPTIELIEVNSSIEISVITNNLTIGKKGEQGEIGPQGPMGICREPRELIYAKINIFENIFINCINHCELINTYFFSLKILNTNIDNLFIENDCIILNNQGMYNIDTSIHINYLNRFEKFNINLILFIYDDITNEFKPLIETLSTHLINGNINKKNDETLNYTLKLQKLLNLNNAKIKIGAYFDDLQYIDDISDYLGNERFPTIELIEVNSSIEISIITNNLTIGKKGEQGEIGPQGPMGICREPRELIYAKINIFENIFINCINHCELINTYFFSLKILNTSIDNLFIENDCIILNDQGMYNIDASIHINYLNRFEKFNTNLIIFIYDNITNEFKPLIETLSTHLINGNINKKNDETLNYTLKLQKLLNLNNAKIKIGAYFDDLQYIDDKSDYLGNERFPTIELIEVNSSIEISIITNNLAIGKEGPQGIKGEKGDCCLCNKINDNIYIDFNTIDISANNKKKINNNSENYLYWTNGDDNNYIDINKNIEKYNKLYKKKYINGNILLSKWCLKEEALNLLETNIFNILIYNHNEEMIPGIYYYCEFLYDKIDNNQISKETHSFLYKYNLNKNNELIILKDGYYTFNLTVKIEVDNINISNYDIILYKNNNIIEKSKKSKFLLCKPYNYNYNDYLNVDYSYSMNLKKDDIIYFKIIINDMTIIFNPDAIKSNIYIVNNELNVLVLNSKLNID